MRFRYSIARYMPSLVRGEVLNVGVVIEDETGRIAAKFLKRLSRIRTIYPDVDLATLRLITQYFSKQLPDPGAQGVLFAHEGIGSLDHLVRTQQNILSLSEPRVTLGEHLSVELQEIYDRFVTPTAGLVPKPISSVHTAPTRLKRRLESWLTKRSLFGPEAYLRDVEVAGTLYPWVFDFGIQNGSTTVVQTIALDVALDVAMNRVALVGARAADVRQAQFRDRSSVVEVIAVPDVVDARLEPIEYLEQHDVEVIPLGSADVLLDRLKRPLASLHRIAN